jgi:F-type H+-transporting ATPase subunit delta
MGERGSVSTPIGLGYEYSLQIVSRMASSAQAAEIDGDETENVGSQNVAAVYAKAFLGATEAAGTTDAALAELESLVSDVFDKLPRLDAILKSGLVSADQKIELIDKAVGTQASPLLRNFLKVLARHGRLDVLRGIRSEARKIVDKVRGRFRVHVSTAAELDGQLQQQLTETLRGMLGGQPVLEVNTRPELIGGIVLRVGDTVYDGSIATRLARIKEQMIDRSVHEIQSGRDRFGSAEGN